MIQQLIQTSRKELLKNYANTQEWAKDYFQMDAQMPLIERAIFGGFTCQQFSFAFLAGYQAALRKMFPTLPTKGISALCVSEAKGGHPKTMQTTLKDQKVNGWKTYVTAGSDVAHLLVLCKTDALVEGKPLMKMVQIEAENAKVMLSDFDLPFMKEIKHGKMHLENVEVSPEQILTGDGYVDYTKPFRTYEDIFVGTAYQAMLLRQAIEHRWEAALRDEILLHLHTLKYLLTLPPMGKETHLLLSAHEASFKRLLPKIEEQMTKYSSPAFQKDWMMNKRVLTLSEKVKAIRLEKARAMLFEKQ